MANAAPHFDVRSHKENHMASLAEELMHTTVRLEGQKAQGTFVGT